MLPNCFSDQTNIFPVKILIQELRHNYQQIIMKCTYSSYFSKQVSRQVISCSLQLYTQKPDEKITFLFFIRSKNCSVEQKHGEQIKCMAIYHQSISLCYALYFVRSNKRKQEMYNISNYILFRGLRYMSKIKIST